jgi:hypothetical protein
MDEALKALTARQMMTRTNGSPWCDTCREDACFSNSWGFAHASDDWPYGIPTELDPNNDHEVTAKEWYATPAFDPPGGSA